MSGKLVFTVGNGMMGDDGAGVLLAKMLHESPLEGWGIIHGGIVPENSVHQVRELAPEEVLLVDATDMDQSPGTIRFLREETLENPFLFSTHTLPLNFLIESLREFVPTVKFLGIQPEVVSFGYPMSDSVRQAVTIIYDGLKRDDLDWEAL